MKSIQALILFAGVSLFSTSDEESAVSTLVWKDLSSAIIFKIKHISGTFLLQVLAGVLAVLTLHTSLIRQEI